MGQIMNSFASVSPVCLFCDLSYGRNSHSILMKLQFRNRKVGSSSLGPTWEGSKSNHSYHIYPMFIPAMHCMSESDPTATVQVTAENV